MPPALVMSISAPSLPPGAVSVCGQVTVVSLTSGAAASPKSTLIEPLPRSVTLTCASFESLSSSRSRRSIRSFGESPLATRTA